MKRMTYVLVAVLACSLTLGVVFAGGEQCQKAAAQKTAMACSATCSGEAFPTMAITVGEKTYQCPVEAQKAAEGAKAKIVYVVGKDKFETCDKAMTALADASECYVKRFMTIACVVDGKVRYCNESACGDSKTGVTGVSAKSGAACSAEKAKLAAGTGTCGVKDTEQTKTVKAGESTGASETKTCDHAKGGTKAETKTVKAEGDHATCQSKTGATVTAPKSGPGCCAAKAAAAAKLAKAGEPCCKDAKNVKYMVAGRTFDKWDDAAKARDQVAVAIKKVSMKYVVDGKEVACDKVCPMAKKDGKVSYVVADRKSCCEIEGRINLAKAQYEAARAATGGDKVAKL